MLKIIFLISVIFLSFLIFLPKPVESGDPSVNVIIQNFQFSPSTLTIAPGTTVTWVNNDSISHTTTADNMSAAESWDSGTINSGQSYSKTFNQAGVYTYHCNIHTYMKGTIQVVAGGQPVTVTTTPLPTSVPSAQLPRTGTSLIAYLSIGLMVLGLKIIKFGRMVIDRGKAQALWEKRRFKL